MQVLAVAGVKGWGRLFPSKYREGTPGRHAWRHPQRLHHPRVLQQLRVGSSGLGAGRGGKGCALLTLE